MPKLDEEAWLRIQYQMAHHDIWWVKAQQMAAGNWTLLLLGALVGVGRLVEYKPTDPAAVGVGRALAVLAAVVAAMGTAYVWDLYGSLVESRNRAANIVQPLQHSAFNDAKRPGKRHQIFPLAVTAVQLVGLVIVLWHFGVSPLIIAALAALVWGGFAIWGLRRTR